MTDWLNREKKFIFQTYHRQPLLLIRGLGSFVWDHHHKKYLDFFSGLGVNNLGYSHPKIVQAVISQVKKVMHTSNLYYTLPQISCAQELIKRTFTGRVFFSNSGAEANECAIKLARRWGHRTKNKGEGEGEGRNKNEIIAFENSFHGRTLATLSLTGQGKYRKDFDPFLERILFAKFNDIESVRGQLSEKTCSIFVEPIQGEGGVNPAQKIFLKSLRKICDQKDLLLVFDEVQCGLGRSGELFCYQRYGVKPDILTLAKGLGGGLPIGATIAAHKVADLLGQGDHASTFGGNPVVCSASEQVLKIMTPQFINSVKSKSALLISGLERLKEKFPSTILEVRGAGLMIGLELKIPGKSMVELCRKFGLLINCTQERILRFLPPLTISNSEIKMGLAILERSLGLCQLH